MTVSQTPVTAPARQQPASELNSPLTAWSVRHRWLTLVLGLAAIVGGGLAYAGLGINSTDSVDQLVGDSKEANRIVDSADFGIKPIENVVVTTRSGEFGEGDLTGIGARLAAAYDSVEGVAEVGEPILGKDPATMVIPVVMAADLDDATDTPEPADVVEPMMKVTDQLAGDNPDLEIGQVGPGSIDVELGETLDRDFKRAELYSLPVTLIILLVAFGAVVAAGVPLLLGLGSVVAAFGITAGISQSIVDVDQNAQSLILLIGLAVGVDYALFILRRAREERAAGFESTEAIVRAGATAGRAVVISGLTVLVAMSGMLVAGGLFTSLAIGAMVVIAVAVVASLTLLPALLAVLGDKVEALRLPFSRRRAVRRGSVDSLWGRLAGLVIRRPLPWALAAAIALLAMAAPALGMRTALPGPESLPQDLKVIDAYNRVEKAVPTEGTTVQVVVQAPATAAQEVIEAVLDEGNNVADTRHVAGLAVEPTVSLDRTVTVLDIGVDLEESDERLPGLVETIRSDVADPLTDRLGGIDGVRVHVGGSAAGTDLAQWMDDRLVWVVAFVLLLTFAVMLVSFGSVWLAGATVGLNLLSVAAAYGVLVLVFQNTWAEELLDFTSLGSIASWLPLLMFVILFGLSMDYHVFVTSRVREARDSGLSALEAVRVGVARSAGVVTSAAAVMVGVFAIFGTLSTLEMKQLGVGLATAIALDATLVRGILLPATLGVLGERAHTGPRWLPRLHH
ncbi:MAG: MMPL family transporter [Nocardioides sp.]